MLDRGFQILMDGELSGLSETTADLTMKLPR